MTFAFHYAGTQEAEYHYGGIGTGKPGVGTAVSSGGYDGTIHVQAIGLGPNGALVLRMWQDVPLAHSLDVPAGEMVVFGTGEVTFDPGQTKFSTPELNLARFLGRGFVDGNHMDEKNHWEVLIDQGEVHVRTDFTVTKNDGGLLDITEKRELSRDNTTTHTDGAIRYDLNRTVPVFIHEESAGTGGAFGLRLKFDYTLQTDSLMTAPPAKT